MTQTPCFLCGKGRLKAYQINFDEAIFLCTEKECPGPLNEPDVEDYIVKRKLSDINCPLEPPKKKQKNQPPSHGASNINGILDLDQILAEHDVCDKKYDLDEMFDTDFNIFETETTENVIEQHSCDPCLPNIPQQVFSGASENRIHVCEPCVPNNPQLARPDGSEKTDNGISSINEQIPIVLSMAASDQTRSETTKYNPLHVPSVQTENTDTDVDSGDFIESLMCFLMHNKLIRTRALKQQKAVFFKRLYTFHKAELSNTKRQNPKKKCDLDMVRRGLMTALKQKGSTWNPHQMSPASSLPQLLKTVSPINDLFRCNYRWEVVCNVCRQKASALDEQVVLSLEKVPDDFTMVNAFCFATCPLCGAGNQKKSYLFYTLPQVLTVHFSNGLPHKNIALDFIHQGRFYKISQVIQQNGKRFFTWTRKADYDSWVKHRSIRPTMDQHCPLLDIQPSEYHLVVWERHEVGTDYESQLARSNCSTPVSSVTSPISNGMHSPSIFEQFLQDKLRGNKVGEEKLGMPSTNISSVTSSSSSSVRSPLTLDRLLQDKLHGGLVGEGRVRTFSRTRMPINSTTLPPCRSNNSEVDYSVPSPSNSEVSSNSSDGDFTIVNSSYQVNTRSNALERQREQTLAVHQKKWKEWTCRAQNSQKRRQPKSVVPEKKKDPKMPIKPVSNLMEGVKIFFQ